MNTIIRYGSLVMLGLLALLPMQAKADTTSPSDVEINFLDLYVSKSADCSSPIHVVHNTSTATQNFVADPKLGTGSVPKGTYPCVIVGINSELTLTVGNSTTASSPPECAKGAIINNQICRNGQYFQNPATPNQLTACSTGSPTEVFAYFSTSGNASNGMSGNGGFVPTGALPLTSALVVTGNHNLQFVVDFDNTMTDDGMGGSCNTQAPVMSAR
jgi:hypothetical protein